MAHPDDNSDDALRLQGVDALHQRLGPVGTLRFLALLSREPFDYQTWRDQQFAGRTLDSLVAEARAQRVTR